MGLESSSEMIFDVAGFGFVTGSVTRNASHYLDLHWRRSQHQDVARNVASQCKCVTKEHCLKNFR